MPPKKSEKQSTATTKKSPERAAKKTAAPVKKKPEPGVKKNVTKKAEPTANKAGAAAAAAKGEAKARRSIKSKKQTASTEKGDRLYCTVCGIVVTVDEECGCESCDLICCGEPMQAVR